MSEADDTIRSTKGVVACLRDNENGTSNLIFDDVDGDSNNNPIQWSFSCFYTWHEYNNSVLDQMNLSDLDYQRIGESLVSRLLALNGRIK